MKGIKRFTAVLLCVIVLTGCVTAGVLGFAAEQEFEPNKVLLKELLDGRSWVIDTLVNNDFSTNPYCKNIPSTVFGGESFNITHNMTDSILDTYEGVFGLDFTVKSLYYFYNSKAVIQTLEDEAVDEVEQDLGFSPGESATFLSDCSKSINEQLYDSILNNVFLEEYTASDGTKLNEDMDSLTDLRYIKKEADYAKSFVDMLGTLQTCLEKNDISYAQGYDGLSTFEDELKYDTGDFDKALVSYMGFFDKYEKMLDSYGKTYGASVKGASDRSAVSKKAEALAASSGLMLLKLMCLNDANYKKKIEAVAQNEETQKIWAPTAADYFKTVGKTFELASSAIDNYVLIEKMFDYDSSIAATLDRCSAQCDIWNLQESYNRYSAYLDEASAQKVAAYKTITDFVSKNNIVYSLVNKGIGKYVKEILPAELAAKGLVNVKSYASTLNEIGLIIKAADFATNQLFDARNLIQCIYEILFIQDIINDAIGAYNDDLSAYQSHPTEENAKFVLDDLDFIKRLRLYSEKVAYKIYKGQQDKGLGLLVNALTGQTVEQLNERNQRITDAYICARLNPVPLKPFELNNATIEISVDEYNNAVAVVTMANGKKYNINEFERVCGAGIVLNKSNLTIVSESDTPCYIPFTYISGQSEISADKSSSLEIGEIVFTSSGKLITAVDDSGALAVRYNIDFANTGATVGGNIELAGSVNGSGIFSGGLTLTAAEEDCEIASSLSVNRLTLNSSKYVSFNAPVTVTGSVSNSRTKTKNAANLILTGSCTVANGSYFGGFTAKDWTCPGSVTVKGDLIAKGTNTINGSLTVNGGFDASGENKSLTVNGSFNAYGDFNYTAGTISGLGSLNLYGDANFGNLTVSLERLNFAGAMQQTLSASSGLTVKNLYNNNTSLSGVTVSGSVTVTDTLCTEEASKFKDSKTVTVTDNCSLGGKTFNGSFKASNWVCSEDSVVNGSITAVNNVTVAENVYLNVDNYYQSGGKTFIEKGAILDVDGSANIANGGTVNGTILVDEDFNASGVIDGSGKLEAKGDVYFTGTSSVSKLVLNGSAAQQLTVSTLNAAEFYNNNTSIGGVKVSGTVNVSDILFTDSASKFADSKSVVITSNCNFGGKPLKGSVKAQNWVCDKSQTVNGTITATGNVTVADGITLTVNGFNQTSGAFKAGENADVTVNGTASFAGGITNGGTVTVLEDFSSSGAVTGGEFNVNGDFSSSGKVDVETLCLAGNLPQIYTSGSTADVDNLVFSNTSNTGITVKSVINVTNEFVNNAKKVINLKNIHINGAQYSGSGDMTGNLIITGEFTVPAGKAYTVDGDLIIESGGSLNFDSGASLAVKGKATLTSCTVTVPSDSSLTVNSYLYTSSAVLNINGKLTVNDDISFNSGSVNGGGTLVSLGDIYASSAKISEINLFMNAKVPQTLSGSTLSFGNISFKNSSSQGVTLLSSVKYTGTLQRNNTRMNNESYLTAA